MASNSEWDTPSGGLTDYEGTVIDAAFAVDNYGKLRLELKMATDNPDVPEWTERFGCGADWKSLDGGETAEHPARKTFLASSGYGRWINGVKDVVAGDKGGNADLVNEAMEAMLGESPRVAKAWIGTKWRLEEKTDTFTDRETKEKRAYSYNVPAEYLGRDEELGGAAAQTPATGADVVALLPEATTAKLREAAVATDHKEFADKALEILMADGLNATPEWGSIIQEVAKPEGMFAALRG